MSVTDNFAKLKEQVEKADRSRQGCGRAESGRDQGEGGRGEAGR